MFQTRVFESFFEYYIAASPGRLTTMMNRTFTLLCAVFLFSLLPQNLSSGQEKIERFLRKFDADRDSRVDTEEMTPQIKRYLRSKGFDTNRSVRISSVVRVIEKAKGNAPPPSSDSKVPGFGVEKDETSVDGVLSFGINQAPDYSEDTNKQALELLRKYDSNKNNVLDEDEMKKIPWGSPKPSQNDKNGDGRLSLSEIESRYHARELAAKDRRRASTKQQLARPKSTLLTSYRGSSGQTVGASSRVASSTTTPASPGISQKQLDKIIKYAEGYFQKHDTNKNGMLEKDELKKMRRPPTSADTNNDGRVSKSEFVASQMPKTSVTGRKPASSSKSRTQSGRRDRSSSSSKSGGSSAKPSVFGGKDKNNDNILQMHEYSDRWTQKTLDAFNKKDKDGDGLITPAEWLQR